MGRRVCLQQPFLLHPDECGQPDSLFLCPARSVAGPLQLTRQLKAEGLSWLGGGGGAGALAKRHEGGLQVTPLPAHPCLERGQGMQKGPPRPFLRSDLDSSGPSCMAGSSASMLAPVLRRPGSSVPLPCLCWDSVPRLHLGCCTKLSFSFSANSGWLPDKN